MHVVNVGNVFRLRADSVNIRICIAVNTSAQNVGNVVDVNRIWQHTCEAIQERNLLNVVFVANDSHSHLTLLTRWLPGPMGLTHYHSARAHGADIFVPACQPRGVEDDVEFMSSPSV